MEKKEEVKVVEVRFFCDQCDNEVVFTGRIQPISPPNYIHACKKCSKQFIFKKAYPSIEYLSLGDINKT